MSSSFKSRAERDPVGFSYFLASNLSLSVDRLQKLLEAQDVIDRLRLILTYLRSADSKLSLACERCGGRVALKREVFSLPGAEGVTGAYVNPHGAVHQTVTVRTLSAPNGGVQLDGRPCANDSWFPGYAWTIAYCGRCFNHLGWRFTLVREEDNQEEEEEEDSDSEDTESLTDSNSSGEDSRSSYETVSEGKEDEDESEITVTAAPEISNSHESVSLFALGSSIDTNTAETADVVASSESLLDIMQSVLVSSGGGESAAVSGVRAVEEVGGDNRVKEF
eukprot:gene26217-32758_t